MFPTFSSVLVALSSISFVFAALAYDISEAEILLEYDYVIVGGGTSGLTVANRLSENAGKYGNCLINNTGTHESIQM